MFTTAIEKLSQFTRPIHTIERNFNSTTIRPGAATLFFVNESGVAITCKHVAEVMFQADQLAARYTDFKNKKKLVAPGNNYQKKLRELSQQFGFTEKMLCELKNRLINCADHFDRLEMITHPKYDLAIVKMINPVNLRYNSHAVFIKDSSAIKQGAFLCRLGYPFPEFNNYQYNPVNDEAEWTNTGLLNSPIFPIEGMVTRFLGDEGKIVGIELSTPGLRGQSGGPLFNSEGTICGMQSATNHLHLGFDMKNQEVIANGEKIRVTNQPFLHVGLCIHVDIIKAFLKENQVSFYEA